MFTHVMLGTNDTERGRAFYDPVLGALGIRAGWKEPDKDRYWYRSGGLAFSISRPLNGEEAFGANGGTIGFAAATPEAVDAFHAAGVANGGTSIEDPPGWRDNAFGRLYLAYLRDPDGNKICALHRPPQ